MTLRRKHILVVDDEPLLVRLNKRQLENNGYSVSVNTESRDALEKFLEDPDKFNLLLTDLTMPGISGAELIKKIRQQSPELPVIVMTGLQDQEIEDQLLELGVNTVIIKPVVGDELLKAVAGVFEEGQQ